MSAGKLDRRVELQVQARGTDGDPYDGQWSTEAEVWAEKMEKNSAARFVSDQTLAESSGAFRIRYRTDVDPTWRVKEEGNYWKVDGAIEGKGRRAETILLVSRYDPNEREVL